MTLTEQTKNRIDSDSNAYLSLKDVPFTKEIFDAHVEGRVAEAERAQVLVDALNHIKRALSGINDYVTNDIVAIAYKALLLYNKTEGE